MSGSYTILCGLRAVNLFVAHP